MSQELILIGILVSLLFYEFTGISPGGVIVAGYLALQLQSPARIGMTLFVAFAGYFALQGLARVTILYGRRRFAAAILLCCALYAIIVKTNVLPADPGLAGYLVPGILVRDLERQKFGKTLLALAIVLGILALLMFWRGLL